MRIKAKGQLRFRIFLVVTLLASIALTYTVFACAKRAGDEATKRSFVRLTSETKRLAADIANTIQTDGVILTSMANLLANQDLNNYRNPIVPEIMNSFNLDKTFIEDLQLLMPDGMMLRRNGTWHNVSALMDFESEANRGAYISDRVESFFDPGEYMMCNAVPVVRDGEVVAMLYGVVPLQTVSRVYKTDAYDGRAFVLIVDGNTGDILLDTWHNKLGNISELGGRKWLKGKGFEQAVEGIRDGESGDMAFISQSTGKILYANYEPVGINNWSITLGVTEEVALAGTRGIVKELYKMVTVVSVILLCYLAYVSWYLISARRSVYRMSTMDQGTGLLNQIAYGELLHKSEQHTISPAICVYIDANGLHELNNERGHEAGDLMLRFVAERLMEQFPKGFLYRVGGDEFVVFPAPTEGQTCEDRMRSASASITAQGYSISYGIAAHESVVGLRELVREADEKMLESKRAYYAEHDRRGLRQSK